MPCTHYLTNRGSTAECTTISFNREFSLPAPVFSLTGNFRSVCWELVVVFDLVNSVNDECVVWNTPWRCHDWSWSWGIRAQYSHLSIFRRPAFNMPCFLGLEAKIYTDLASCKTISSHSWIWKVKDNLEGDCWGRVADGSCRKVRNFALKATANQSRHDVSNVDRSQK